ncbi:MAG TPA: ABC transporter permease subunit [Acidimicrobiales bacterium]|nr:ABC transporter permease subunit [Acidimicrobiales bacterium]
MTTELALVRPGRMGRSPGTVIAGLTIRKAVRSGVLWGYIFGIVVASSALSYVSIYKTQAERHRLEAAFGSNNATSALFGPATRLQTVAGFTVFKVSMTLMILGAVWGLLTSTRLLRGEEDAGRWELLLAGQTTPRRATAQVVIGLASGVGALWALTVLITIVAGHSAKVHIGSGPAMFLALALVSSAVMFLAVGALTSQLAATRRQAAAYAAAVLGVSYGVRMTADSGVGLHSLRWASPLGWVEELQPLTAPRPLALVPIAAFTIVLLATAVRLAGARDLGASTVPDRVHATPHVELLGGPLPLTIRLIRSTVTSWWVAIAVSGLLLGLVAQAAGATISGSSLKTVFTRLGAPGAGADAYLGVAFLMVAILVAFSAVGLVNAARGEESGGRLEHLVVRPFSRSAWFWGRILVAVSVLVASGVIAGVFTWLGTASEHAGVRFGTTLNAGLNVVPPALCILGIGALVVGVRPRAASVVTYGVLTWSLLVEVIGGIGAMNHWVLDTSVFHHMAAAPAVSPNWRTDAVMVAAGALGAVIGGFALTRRDLQGE